MNLVSHLREILAPHLQDFVTDQSQLVTYLGMLKPTLNVEHGDYQANFAMALAKQLGRKPGEIAEAIRSRLLDSDLFDNVAVAGPGFINLRLKSDYLAALLVQQAQDERLGVPAAPQAKTFVIDYSGPNVAKPLHVGHLRSTIIGDALVRLLRFAGHHVIGDNHLGDWGTQFGILLYGYKHHLDREAFARDPVRELARLYVHVRSMFRKSAEDDDDAITNDPVKKACQEETARLHSGDPENVGLWKQFMPACLAMLKPIYDRLDVHIDHAYGESFYHPMLPGVVEEMLALGIAQESQGAVVIPNAKGVIPRSDEELRREEPPAIIRKRDGAYTYTTTDLATIKFRMQTWKPDAILYVVDKRQALHFKTVFAQARRWGYDRVEFQHIQFGSVLGEDKKPFQTRAGGVIELSQLLDEAVEKARQKYDESYNHRRMTGHKVPEFSESERQEIAEAVGIGAVKYADLSSHRTSDYVFSYEKMLATDGNTATYMQYAYARCRAIFREGRRDEAPFRSSPPAVHLHTPAERALALQLLRLAEAIDAACADYLPHIITAYLWDLAKAASIFYESCPVLKAESAELRDSRLLLVDLVGRVIQKALGLLGIRTLERM